ncbi:hypothetical protein JL722_14352 [Aureococcus anophagefferens]|nr:hypothetical protein JL722_14352 [Aureococcus anophagefferens]
MLCRLVVLAAAAAAFAPAGLTARTSVAMSATMSKAKLTTMVKGLTKETFESIYEQEAWIVENGGKTWIKKTLKRVDEKAKAFGLTVKPDFLAKEKRTTEEVEAAEAAEARALQQQAKAQAETRAAEDAAALAEAEAEPRPPRRAEARPRRRPRPRPRPTPRPRRPRTSRPSAPRRRSGSRPKPPRRRPPPDAEKAAEAEAAAAEAKAAADLAAERAAEQERLAAKAAAEKAASEAAAAQLPVSAKNHALPPPRPRRRRRGLRAPLGPHRPELRGHVGDDEQIEAHDHGQGPHEGDLRVHLRAGGVDRRERRLDLVKKTLKRADHKAKSFGLTMKPEFLAGHKIMVKHKEKREEFFARKTEEVKAAEEEAAAAAEAAAAEAAEAAAEPAEEEPAAEEAAAEE